jgi:tripartite ATP-independent transporter DctM subunit
MSVAVITILTITFMFVLFLSGMRIGLAMAFAGLIGYALLVDVRAGLDLMALDVFGTFFSYTYISIPLFVFMGQIAARSGIAKRVFDCTHKFIGHVPSGLAIGTLFAGTLFKAVCGSQFATTATFATIALPEMDRYNYDKRLSTGIVSVVGTLGGLIPPTISLIIYAILADVSIGKMFLAGIFPGLLLALSFGGTLAVWCKINPALGPRSQKFSWKARFASLPSVLWVGAIFLVVMGGLVGGFFTPTEAGGIGAGFVCLVSFVKKDISLKELAEAAKESLCISAMIIVLLVGATILGHFFTVTRSTQVVSDVLTNLHINRYLVLTLILLVYLIGGEFIEDTAFFILATPIFAPIAAHLGFNLVHFGILITATIAIGLIIPPMAMVVFLVAGIAKVPISLVYKGIYPFLIGMTICVIILMFFPQISTWLPELFMK